MTTVSGELATTIAAGGPIDESALGRIEWAGPASGWETQGHRFACRTTDPALDAELRRVFRDMTPLRDTEISSGDTEVLSLFAYESDPAARWAIVRDGQHLRRRQSRAMLLPTVMWRCNQGVIATTSESSLSLHAGAVARDGRAIVMAAPQEAGKTTLTAGLLRRGLDYLTDEAAVLDRDTLEVTAYPKPLSIDRGSWPLFPELEPRGPRADFVDDQWLVPSGTGGLGAAVDRASPALVLAPQYTPGGRTAAHRVRPAEMVQLLSHSTFHFSRHTLDNLHALARLVERCDYYRLEVADLESACDLVIELLENAP